MYELYHAELLELAQACDRAARLEESCQTAEGDSPLCGDHAVMDVCIRDRRIRSIGQNVRGCLLCRAAAGAVLSHVPGMALNQALGLAHEAERMLTMDETPWTAWLGHFMPARAHPARHGCILLPLRILRVAAESS